MYGLRLVGHTQPLKFYIEVHEPSYCVELVDFPYGSGRWLVDSFEVANSVRLQSPSKADSCYKLPFHEYMPERLEVVEFEITFEGEIK